MGPSPGAPAEGATEAVGTPILSPILCHSISGLTAPSQWPCPTPGLSTNVNEAGLSHSLWLLRFALGRCRFFNQDRGCHKGGTAQGPPQEGPVVLWEPLQYYQTRPSHHLTQQNHPNDPVRCLLKTSPLNPWLPT